MEVQPVTDSTELHIPRDTLCSTQPNVVISTAVKDVHGLKWSIECYRRPASKPNTADLFVIGLRVSHLPVKCSVKYTIGDISDTTDVICSKLIDPVILSIGRDVLIQKIGNDDGLTFKCELTFTHVSKAIGTPAELDLSKHHHFTGTVTLFVQQFTSNSNETTRCPIDKDGRFRWSMSGCRKNNSEISFSMRTSAAHCQVMMIYEYAGSNFFEVLRGSIKAANPNQNRYHATLPLPAHNSPIDAVVIKCTAYFTFDEPIYPYIEPEEQPVAAESNPAPQPSAAPVTTPLATPNLDRSESDTVPHQLENSNDVKSQPGATESDSTEMKINPPSSAVSAPQQFREKKWVPVPLQGKNTNITSIYEVESPSRITMLLPFNSASTLISPFTSVPDGLTWALQVPPFKRGKKICVYLHVSSTPICADIVYNVPIAYLTERKVVTIRESESPKFIFEIPNNDMSNEVFKVTCDVQFSKLADDGTVKTQPTTDALPMTPLLPKPQLTKANPSLQSNFTVSMRLSIDPVRSIDYYKVKSGVQNGPGSLKWWMQFEPDMEHDPEGSQKKMILVSWHVSNTPVSASISYSESKRIIEKPRDVVIGTHDPVPKLIFKLDHDDFMQRRWNKGSRNVEFRVEFRNANNTAANAVQTASAVKELPKVSNATAESVNQTKDDGPSDVDTSTDEFFDAVSFQSEPSGLEIAESCQWSDDAYETPDEDVPVSDNESDDISNLSSSDNDDDGCDEEDGMTDQQRLAYRLQRQNEETLAVQELLANNKNIPMIADGSIFE